MRKLAEWRQRGALFWSPEEGPLRPLLAGSGLIGLESSLWIVGDDLHHLVRFPRDGALSGEGYRIFPGDLPSDFQERKRLKPDTECLIELGGAPKRLLAFPSGSKKRRVRGSLVTLGPNETFASAQEVDLSPLLHSLDALIPDLNIEGGTLLGETLLLMQRGNGKARVNAVVELPVAVIEACIAGAFDATTFTPRVRPVDLPDVDGVTLTFTDATTFDGRVYFSAAAERKASTVDDGPVAGSAIGWLNGDQGVIVAQARKMKIEGLTKLRASAQGVTFLAVTDADSADVPSLLLEIDTPAR